MTSIATPVTSMKTFKELNTAHPQQTADQLRQTRNKQIIEMRQCGFTISQIAEYFELSLSGIGYILQNTPDSPYRRGIGNNDLGGRKITCDMSVKVRPEPTPMNNVIALEVKPKVSFFPNRLMRGVG